MSWDSSLRECSLETVLNALYREEINCGLGSFWDGGWDVWIGDEMNGFRAEATFERANLDKVPEWLVTNAERLYPMLTKSEAVVPQTAQTPDDGPGIIEQ